MRGDSDKELRGDVEIGMGEETDNGDGFFLFVCGEPITSLESPDLPELPKPTRRPIPRMKRPPNRVLDSSNDGSSVLEPRVGVPHLVARSISSLSTSK